MKRSYTWLIICAPVFFAGCQSQALLKKASEQQVTVENDPLEMHGDSVRISLQATVPSALVSEKTAYTLLPEFQYGEGAFPLDEIPLPMDGQQGKVTLHEKMVIPYLQGMDRGELRVKGLLEDKKTGKTYSTAYTTVATGVISTPNLVRLGQFVPGERIPQVGAYMSYDEDEALSAEPVDGTVSFGQGSAEVNGLPKEIQGLISQNRDVKVVSVIGMVSPETIEHLETSLPRQRAENLMHQIKSEMAKKGDVDKVRFTIGTKQGDWMEFRRLLRTYDKIDVSEKEKYFDVIYSNKAYREQLEELKQVPSYNMIARDLFPQMQTAKVTLMVGKDRKSDPEISALANRYINGTAEAGELTEGELAYAAEFNPGLKDKQALYEILVEQHGSALAYNNLGVVYLNQAHRMIKVSDQNNKVSDAIQMFERSIMAQETAHAYHNLGQAYLMRGDYQGAYLAISEANALSGDNQDFKYFNEGKRGAIDIIRGDYKLATVRLDRAPENEMNLFNKGLAHYMAEEYREAAIAFEESASANMEYGYAFYGLALVAAKNNDEERLYEFMPKAVERSPYLKRRAATDWEFKAYREKAAFREAIR